MYTQILVISFAFALNVHAQSGRLSPADSLRRDSTMRATQKATQQDYQSMLKQLNIISTRPGPSGNPQAPNAANVDEAKASPYTTLPDPLILKNGKKAKNDFWQRNRELLAIQGCLASSCEYLKWQIVFARRWGLRHKRRF